MNKYKLALFDFDGTLADTAGDMAGALNILLQSKNKKPIPFDQLRPHISNGTPALLKIGFGLSPNGVKYELLKSSFLEIYEENICIHTDLFPGISDILERCQNTNLPWGIVTNKPEKLTLQIIEQLGLSSKVACVIGGDSLPERKPSPMPLLHACKLTGFAPQDAVYIGDSVRDVQAGINAGLDTIGVTYGYIPPNDDPKLWKAKYLIDSVAEIADLLWLS